MRAQRWRFTEADHVTLELSGKYTLSGPLQAGGLRAIMCTYRARTAGIVSAPLNGRGLLAVTQGETSLSMPEIKIPAGNSFR